MLPTTAPIVLVHLAVTRRQGRGVHLTALFVVAYLFVWSAIGLIPLLAYKAFAQLADAAAQSYWLPTLAGGSLAAGAASWMGAGGADDVAGVASSSRCVVVRVVQAGTQRR